MKKKTPHNNEVGRRRRSWWTGGWSVGVVAVGSVGPVAIHAIDWGRMTVDGLRHPAVPTHVLGLDVLAGDHEIEGGLVEQRVDRLLDAVDPFAEHVRCRARGHEDRKDLMGFGSFEDQPDVSKADLGRILGEGVASTGSWRAAHDADLAECREQFRDERSLKTPCVGDVCGRHSSGPGTLPEFSQEAHCSDGGFSLFAVHTSVIAD